MSLAIENVVIEPRVISSCLPISMTSSSLVGSESRSTMLAASLAADVPLFIARPTSDWASAGASLVPSPVMATRWPSACSSRMKAILSSGVACAMKSSTPASLAIVAAVRGLSPVIMTVRMPILRNSANRSTSPSLTVSLSSIRPRRDRRCGPRAAWRRRRRCGRTRPTSSGAIGASRSAVIASTAPFRIRTPSVVRTPLVRVSALNGISSAIVAASAAKPASSPAPAG